MTDETMMSFTEESAGLFLASDYCERQSQPSVNVFLFELVFAWCYHFNETIGDDGDYLGVMTGIILGQKVSTHSEQQCAAASVSVFCSW